jgi:DNA polymerase-3 subunit delta
VPSTRVLWDNLKPPRATIDSQKIGLAWFQRPVICIFCGPDSFTLHEALAELKAELNSDGMLATNTATFEGNQVRPDELLAVCGTVPFMGAHRLVLVEGLLARFEVPRGRRRAAASQTGEPGRQADLGPWRDLPAALEGLPPSTALVFVDGDISENNALLRLLSPLAQVRRFPRLSQRDLPGWIQARAHGEGVDISPAAVRLLADLVGNDLWALWQELKKLALYAGGRRVEDEDVRALTVAAREASVFTLVDAVVEGRPDQALRLLEQLLDQGAAAPYLLAIITRQYRNLLLAKEMLRGRYQAAEIGQRLGIASHFALGKVLEQAGRYPPARLEASYRRLLEADASIKSGIYREELALEVLVQDLARMAAAPSPGRAAAWPRALSPSRAPGKLG